MEIKDKVWCLFEQSGTFKNEFKKLGYDAVDVDIQNNFGETDYQIDIFSEIEKAYEGGQESIFDKMTKDDLIMAFFHCIYFCAPSQMNFTWGCINYRKMSYKEKTDAILKRSSDREKFYGLAIKMFSVVAERGLRLIMENPWSENTYLKANFIIPPALIDNNRMLRGDYRIKPTAYWYVNCEPTNGKSYQNDKEKKIHMKSRGSKVAGICSEERSMIHPDYARNFICDFIIGKEQQHTMRSLF
jgi:hypothetical protein